MKNKIKVCILYLMDGHEEEISPYSTSVQASRGGMLCGGIFSDKKRARAHSVRANSKHTNGGILCIM